MATKLNVAALTLNTEEAQNVSEAVLERVFVQGELNNVHDIRTGVQHDQQIVFIDNLDVGGEAMTNCVPVEQSGLTLTEKVWTPKLIAGRFTHCANDLAQLLKLFKKAQRVNPDHFDRINSQELAILMVKVSESIKTSVHAKAWIGDTAAAVFAGGNFTIANFNVNLWDQFDGIWKQVFADGNIPRYTIAENANATYVLQVLAADKGRTILQSVYENADPRLIGASDAQFIVTRTIWDNYMTTIENKQGNGGIIERLENGALSIRFRGIPVKVDYEMDRIIRKYHDDLTVHWRPSRCLLTVPGNIPIATLNTDDLQNLTSIYDPVGLQNIIDYAYYLDVKHGESYLSSVAY